MSGAQCQRLLERTVPAVGAVVHFAARHAAGVEGPHRRLRTAFDEPATPYQRLLASGPLSTMA